MYDLHESDGLQYMDSKLKIPFTHRNAMMKTLHKEQRGQIAMKYIVNISGGPI